jgi:opacity protein-like surface antigen
MRFILISRGQKATMQKILLSVVICLLFTLPLPAQNFLDHVTAEVGAGFSFPLGTFANHAKNGFNFVASGGPRFNRHFTLTLDFSLHYMDVKNFLETSENVDISQGSMIRFWTLTVNPGYEFIKQERFSTYATGGYGLYNRKLLLAAPGVVPAAVCDTFWNVCVGTPASAQMVSGDFSLYKGGYNVGGGVTFGARTKFFAETRYHHMFTARDTTLIPLTFGVRW